MPSGLSVSMERLAQRLVVLPRARKRALMLCADAICIPAALWTAVLLKTGAVPDETGAGPWLYLAAAVMLSYLTYQDPANLREYVWVRRVEWWPTLGLLGLAMVFRWKN